MIIRNNWTVRLVIAISRNCFYWYGYSKKETEDNISFLLKFLVVTRPLFKEWFDALIYIMFIVYIEDLLRWLVSFASTDYYLWLFLLAATYVYFCLLYLKNSFCK